LICCIFTNIYILTHQEVLSAIAFSNGEYARDTRHERWK